MLRVSSSAINADSLLILLIMTAQELDLDTKLKNIRQVVNDLPRPYFDLLKRLIEHLDK